MRRLAAILFLCFWPLTHADDGASLADWSAVCSDCNFCSIEQIDTMAELNAIITDGNFQQDVATLCAANEMRVNNRCADPLEETELDDVGELEAQIGTGLIANTEIDTSAELISILTDETGTGQLVFHNQPKFVIQDSASCTTDEGRMCWDNAGKQIWVGNGFAYVTFTSVAGVCATGEFLDGDDSCVDVITESELSVSAQLAGQLSDETGSGALVFQTSPSLSGPTINTGVTNNLTLNDGLIRTRASGDYICHDYDDDGVCDRRFYKGERCVNFDFEGDSTQPEYNTAGTRSMHTCEGNEIGCQDAATAASTGAVADWGFPRASTTTAGYHGVTLLRRIEMTLWMDEADTNKRINAGTWLTNTDGALDETTHGVYFLCAPADDVDGNSTAGSVNDLYWWFIVANNDTNYTGKVCDTLSGAQCATYTALNTTAWNTEVSCDGADEKVKLVIEFDPSSAAVRGYVNDTLEATITTNIPTSAMWSALAMMVETTTTTAQTLVGEYMEYCYVP